MHRNSVNYLCYFYFHRKTTYMVKYQHRFISLVTFQVAERVVSKLKSLETLDFNLQVDKLTEEANLFWARGEQNIAKHMMKKLLKMLEQVSYYKISLSLNLPYISVYV